MWRSFQKVGDFQQVRNRLYGLQALSFGEASYLKTKFNISAHSAVWKKKTVLSYVTDSSFPWRTLINGRGANADTA